MHWPTVQNPWSQLTMEYCSALKEEGTPTICDNMDEPEGHYAKGSRSDIAGQILPLNKVCNSQADTE